MRSRQLALCAAVAACAVTTAPAYGGDERATGAATGSATVLAHPAPATPRGTVTLRGTGCTAGRATVRSAAFHDAPPLAALPARALPQPAKAAKVTKATKAAKAASSDELSSTSAVGLVLAGGAILVIAGQLLRLRLRLRRERRGDADER
ncbi:hypothetical protein DDE74_14570 [Streptomyces lydicus]|uniref:Tat pathway signal sequence domain protein n=1 Tax=Streptomyces lydicus TaxID=47763 RepID=A0A3Q9K5L8_9ACTN|nr:hypothetical protein [Streptomyces lydicus]AZS72005.1 hypothetical protein DDE74_14570 [Streptomyces lydicus]